MKLHFKRIFSLALTLVLITGLTGVLSVSAAEPCTERKLPDTCAYNGQTYTLNTDSRIPAVADQVPAGDLVQTARLIRQELVWGTENQAENGDQGCDNPQSKATRVQIADILIRFEKMLATEA